VYLIGEALEEQDERGQWVKDDDFLLLLNGHYEAIRFTLPWKGNSELVLDTALSEAATGSRHATSPILAGRSLALLTQRRQAGQVAVPLLRRRYFMPFGAQLLEGGRVRFRLWAPRPNGWTCRCKSRAAPILPADGIQGSRAGTN
jgi:hypothetical protein